MADYTLRYSGADIDSICDKVTDMRFTAAEISNFFEKKDKLRMVWRKHVLEGETEAGITRYSTVTFPDVFPAGLENRDDLFIIAGSDYGKMTHGWKRIDDSWMFFDENGHMMTGWIHVNNTYYYLGSDGKMVSGTTITIDGNSYTFDANGAYTGGGNIAAKEVSVRSNTGTSASSGSSSGSSSSGSSSSDKNSIPGTKTSRDEGQDSDAYSGPGAGGQSAPATTPSGNSSPAGSSPASSGSSSSGSSSQMPQSPGDPGTTANSGGSAAPAGWQ